MISLLSLLADAAATGAAEIADAQGPAAENAPPGLLQYAILFAPAILLFVGMNWFLGGGQRREQTRHSEMINNLKKNDRVVTAGGIIGTVASVSEDKAEVTLKVDDNTRLKFRSESIRGPLEVTSQAAKPVEEKAS
ncbi:MAG: preprotein translocase subunit YajC [Planctomycetaceae bacterium]